MTFQTCLCLSDDVKFVFLIMINKFAMIFVTCLVFRFLVKLRFPFNGSIVNFRETSFGPLLHLISTILFGHFSWVSHCQNPLSEITRRTGLPKNIAASMSSFVLMPLDSVCPIIISSMCNEAILADLRQ